MVRIGAYINPPVIVANLPVEEVRRIPRPNVVDPQRPPSDPATEQEDYSLGSDQADSVVENLASSMASSRERGIRSTGRDVPRHPPLMVDGHVVVDNEGRINPEGIQAVQRQDTARLEALGIPRARLPRTRLPRGSVGEVPIAKAMPAQPKAMPRPQATEVSSSSHEAPSLPEVDQVLEMETEDIPADVDADDE
eukprot:1948549-Amphidinium_carterae.1